jgi:mannose-6-phosphate isomerase-like protein (cupin superfamily)
MTMQAFDLGTILEGRARADRAWLEFLRVASLSMGVYYLRAGQHDSQTPHEEDEVYYIVGGQAQFRAGETVRHVSAGAILFVPARQEHRFIDITDDVTALVFFAPAEGSLATGTAQLQT